MNDLTLCPQAYKDNSLVCFKDGCPTIYSGYIVFMYSLVRYINGYEACIPLYKWLHGKWLLWGLWMMGNISILAQQQKTVQNLEGAWTGYTIDLSVLNEDELPKIDPIKMVLRNTSDGKFSGVISKNLDDKYSAISGFIGTIDAQKNTISFSENGLFKVDNLNSKQLGCRIVSSLSIFNENNKVVLDGRYYGLTEVANNKCPVGRIHFERPKIDSSKFAYLANFMDKRPLVAHTMDHRDKGQIKNTNVKFKGITISDSFSDLYFPEILVLTNQMGSLRDRLKYDVYKLAQSQVLLKMDEPLEMNEEEFSIVFRNNNPLGDTINLLIDGVELATNHVLLPHTAINFKMKISEKMILNKIKMVRHLFAIVPFSWGIKTSSIIIEVFDRFGKMLSSHSFKYLSNQNVEIPLILNNPK